MAKASYRKLNDKSQSSSKYHKLDGTAVRAIMKRQASGEVASAPRQGLGKAAYEPDDVPLTEEYIKALESAASRDLPKGVIVQKRSLLQRG